VSLTLEQYRAAYERLRPTIPQFPGEREWPDRLRSWDDFVQFGPLVAEQFRALTVDERAGRSRARGELERLRTMAPDLADLVLRAFAGHSR